MKKTKFIALVLVVAVMLVGAGYAAWSEQLTATATIRTGDFDMSIISASIRTGDNEAQNYAHNPPWSQYDWTHSGNVEVANNKKSVEVEFLDLYPGGHVQMDLTTKNLGTIPAKLASIDVEFLNGNEELFDLIQAQSSYKADVNGDGYKGWSDPIDKSAHINNFAYWYSVTQELETELMNNLNTRNVVIEPNGTFALDGGEEEPNCIVFRLDPDAGNEFQGKSCKFKITFNWEQWSTDADNFDTYGGDGDFIPAP